MATTAQATAAPVEIELGGKTYRMSPLTDRDLGEFDRWLQTRIIRMARESITDDMSEADRRLTMDVAIERASLLSIATPAGRAAATSLDGVAKLLHIGIQHHHDAGEVSVDDVRTAMLDEATMVGAMDRFDLANEALLRPAGVKKKTATRTPRTTRTRKKARKRTKRSR